MTESYLIAHEELNQKKIPFIIKRRLPDGTFEYWRIIDLIIF
jgi:DNA-directed RNA polymerase I, II, and III subunit RPABC2